VTTTGGRAARFYTSASGEQRVSVDAPGVAAVSAPVGDPLVFLAEAARSLGLVVDDTSPGVVTIATPAS
jgi:hypothetical protein